MYVKQLDIILEDISVYGVTILTVISSYITLNLTTKCCLMP